MSTREEDLSCSCQVTCLRLNFLDKRGEWHVYIFVRHAYQTEVKSKRGVKSQKCGKIDIRLPHCL